MLTLLTAGAIVFGGCNKKETPPNIVTNMRMTINGKGETTKNVTAVYSQGSNILNISTTFPDSSTLSIEILYPGQGFFNVYAGDVSPIYTSYVPDKNSYVAIDGILSITQFSNRVVSGNFHFSVLDINGNPGVINDGNFAVAYATEP
jgi:hypothetical protein